MFACLFVTIFQTEQLTELKQELMKKEDQLRDVKKNSTNLEKKLEYERWVCFGSNSSVGRVHFGPSLCLFGAYGLPRVWNLHNMCRLVYSVGGRLRN